MNKDFEEFFVEFAVIKIAEKDFSHSGFARQVFPDLPRGSAERLWRRVRNPEKKGEPRALSLKESVRVGEILSEGYASFVWQVEQYMKQKQAE